MAGSLVQVPTVVAVALTATRGRVGDTVQTWRRFRILAGLLHVVCRLVVVSEPFVCLEVSQTPGTKYTKWCCVCRWFYSRLLKVGYSLKFLGGL